MANNVVQPGQMQEPGELLDPEKGSRFEQYKVDGVYEYGIKNGKKDKSRVRVTYYEGDIFEGTLRHRKYVGFGKYSWKNGGIYEGTFKKGKLNGKGKYTEANGETYEGEFKNNKYNGAGKYTWADGSTFDGVFKNGQIISGRFTDAEGNLYSCSFKYKRNGERKVGKMQLLRTAPLKDIKKEEKHEEKKVERKVDKNTEKKAEKQKGQDVAEYVTFEGSNYLFRSEDLAVKYGGKVENGQIVITPELESTYNRLRYEQMTASNSQLGQEYAAVKQVNPDSIVFYRIGDFYEVLGEDARRAAEVLDLTLTGRMLGDERIPMAGVPFHAIDEYAQKLAASGENVVVTGKDDGAKKINAVKAPNLDNRMERRISAYAESLKKIDVELGYAARSDDYYRDRAMKEIAAYEQSDEYKQAVREDFPKDFIEDSPQDMREIPQNKPVQGNESVREWYSIELPSDAVAGRYGENTMIKMPKGEFSNYVFFIPTKLIRILDDKKSIRIASDYLFKLNNDGRQVELTGQELQDSFAGKHIDKTYKRVAASRRFAQGLENLEKNVPAELKEIPAWCCYRTRWNPDKGKKDKFIISTIDGKWTSSKEPNKWVTFEAALKYARENNCEGLSLLLDKKYGITCIDLDKCYLNAETGEKKERATKLLEELKGTYIERSTSGNGIHIFLKDDILKGGIYNSTSMVKDEDPRGDLEVYDDKRIISMTGDMLSESNELNRAGSAATVYLRQELGEARSQKKYDAKFKPTTGLNLSDNELINWIQKSKQGSKFNDLMTGKGISGDRSADDAKLAHMLLYFSGGDKEQTFRIMRESDRKSVV